MIKLFGHVLIRETEYNRLCAGWEKFQEHRLSNAVLKDQLKRLTAEVDKLADVERKYKRLTDRDEKGRFVKRDGD